MDDASFRFCVPEHEPEVRRRSRRTTSVGVVVFRGVKIGSFSGRASELRLLAGVVDALAPSRRSCFYAIYRYPDDFLVVYFDPKDEQTARTAIWALGFDESRFRFMSLGDFQKRIADAAERRGGS